MRLQLLIQRHALPPVHIIYTTGAGPASHTRSRDSTIADLLNDVNDIVPLESADGEWGLEDYAVEVAATADQSSVYECLHYQTCESVLREDDQVIIRALTSEDLRVRRLSGRHQITGDGRHLVDGIPFGKQWLRRPNRPGIVIPPRKKRKLLTEEQSSDSDEPLLQQLLDAEQEEDNAGAMVPFIGDDDEEDDDDEDDEDFVAEEEAHQITIREEFEDADVVREDEAEQAGEVLDEEVQLLLKDAEDIANAGGGSASRRLFERKLKRKRDIDDEGQPDEDDTFEGFSTPAKSPKKDFVDDNDGSSDVSDADSLMAEISARQAEKLALNVVEDNDPDQEDEDSDSDFNPEDDANTDGDRIDSDTEEGHAKAPSEDEEDEEPDSDTSLDDDDSSSAYEAESTTVKLAMEQAKKRVLNLVNAFENDMLEDSRGDKNSSHPQGEPVTQQDVDETSSSGSGSGSDTSSESESDSDSEADTSESESASEDEDEEGKVQEQRKTVPAFKAAPSSAPPAPPTNSQVDQQPTTTPPGQGKVRTQKHNERVKKRKRLEALKREGLLPENADFKALAEYEQGHKQGAMEEDEAGPGLQEPPLPRDTSAQATNGVEITSKDATADTSGQDSVGVTDVADASMTADSVVSPLPEAPKASQKEAETVTEAVPKRARLDLASSRRMLFSSLGLRTPKTPEAEQALREKLSKSIRPNKQVAAATTTNEASSPQSHAPVEDDNSWQSKLVVLAVECEGSGGLLEPPPFPFRQSWTKPVKDGNKKKRQLRDQDQFYQSRDEQDPNSNEGNFAPDVSTLDVPENTGSTSNRGTTSSETVKAGSDAMPAPIDFESLPTLAQDNIHPGALIAYRELHVDATTNWQPEISAYRVAEVLQLDQDNTIHVRLDPNSLKAESKPSDDDTNESKTYGFEIVAEDASQEDDGTREIQLSNMISAKLVKTTSVEVPESSHVNGPELRGGEAAASSSGDQFAVIPESAEQDTTSQQPGQPQISIDEIATPRRDEISVIIREAGFDSALDAQLLQPITNGVQFRKSASPSGEADEDSGHNPRKKSPHLDFVPSEDPPSGSSVTGPDDLVHHDGGADMNFDSEPPTSSPFVHTQESVDYPHISQMAIDSSGVVQTANSSSHQDAQKLSHAPVVDLSFTISEQEKSQPKETGESEGEVEARSGRLGEEEREVGGDAGEQDEADDPSEYQESPVSLKSEVPQSQSQSQDIHEENTQDQSSERRSSFLGGLGYDGHDSSYRDDDEEYGGNSDDNSDDLPSLRELTSSQQVRIRTRSSSRKVSPPPTRKSLRTMKSNKKSTPPSSPELPPSSQPEPKLSQSEEPRFSQIPLGSQIVDLTLDGSSPAKTDDDVFIPKTRTRTQVNGHRNSQGRAARQVSGVGTRRLLTTKKSRNYF